MTALTTLLAARLTGGAGSDWFAVVRLLGPERTIGKIHRRAKNKCADGDDAAICRMVILDWMKEQPRHNDKVLHIRVACLTNNTFFVDIKIKYMDLWEYNDINMCILSL